MVSNYNIQRRTVLVLSPHPDDEVLGCGGSLLRFAAQGSEIRCLYLNRAEQSCSLRQFSPEQRVVIRENEVARVAKRLGFCSYSFLYAENAKPPDRRIEEAIGMEFLRFRPDVIFLPWYGDNHPEHRLLNQYMLQTAIPMHTLKDAKVLAYEIWSPIPFPDVSVDITGEMKEKLRILALYKSVTSSIRYGRAIRGLNSYRSLHLHDGNGFCECFISKSLREYLLDIKAKACESIS